MGAIEESILQNARTLAVLEAAIRALIQEHPYPAAVALATRSLLMQAQSGYALYPLPDAAPTSLLSDLELQILERLFRPPIVLPPDAG